MPGYLLCQSDARTIPLPDKSVHMCVTSPPYFGLRDYGTDAWEGGDDPACDHKQPSKVGDSSRLRLDGREHIGPYDGEKATLIGFPYRSHCRKCGARRVDRQIGLEDSIEAYVDVMVRVFREVKRVLRDDGTAWINLGDSYISNGCGWGGEGNKGNAGGFFDTDLDRRRLGLAPKNQLGMPWRVAFALQQDGWVLRSEIIWAKSNAMPESCRDRPTKSHEQLFLFAKAKWIGPGQGRFAHISPEDARWLALLIDAEGNICVKRVRRETLGDQFGAQIAIGSTSRVLMEKVAGIVGKGTVHERTGTNAPMHYWQVVHKDARDLLQVVYPYLIVKPRQAQLAIYLENLTRHRGMRGANKWRTQDETDLLLKIWETNKLLNHFGEPDLSWVPEVKQGHWVPNRYFYDAEAVREPAEYGYRVHTGEMRSVAQDGRRHTTGTTKGGDPSAGRNMRSVITLSTEAFPGAHFATFPRKLVEPCVKAGSSARGCCPRCGAGWTRTMTDGELRPLRGNSTAGPKAASGDGFGRMASGYSSYGWTPGIRERSTLGWHASCSCPPHAPVPAVILDPFAGSGTTLVVANALGRRGIGLDLSREYLVNQAQRRLERPHAKPLRPARVEPAMPLFGDIDP